MQYAQWFLMAIITFWTAAMPGLDAQTRLAIGKRLEYRVTEKVPVQARFRDQQNAPAAPRPVRQAGSRRD